MEWAPSYAESLPVGNECDLDVVRVEERRQRQMRRRDGAGPALAPDTRFDERGGCDVPDVESNLGKTEPSEVVFGKR